jgi:hypothetical protein
MSGFQHANITNLQNCLEYKNCQDVKRLAHNGPAIKGGCVTWRSHPAIGPGTLAGKLSRWQDRYGVLFAILVQILLSAGAVAVQV